MDVVSKEILAPSKVYFYTCSALAREIFFYPLCTGHFYCDKGYEVNRGRYDSFLLICVQRFPEAGGDGRGVCADGLLPAPALRHR